MIKYPLYDELLRQVNEKEEQMTDTSYICSTINAISFNADMAEHYEEIHALVLYYELLTNSNILLTNTPFDGRILPGNKGVLNTLMKMPLNLRKILIQYIEYYS